MKSNATVERRESGRLVYAVCEEPIKPEDEWSVIRSRLTHKECSDAPPHEFMGFREFRLRFAIVR